jgi:hypothetical protein
VTLRASDSAKASVKVAAQDKVGDGTLAIETIERAEEGQRGYGAVEKTRVRLFKGVAGKDA